MKWRMELSNHIKVWVSKAYMNLEFTRVSSRLFFGTLRFHLLIYPCHPKPSGHSARNETLITEMDMYDRS